MPDRNLPGTTDRKAAIGLGTWRMGESASTHGREVAAVRTALDLGYRMIDTAEMYGEGGAERVVGQALREAFAGASLGRDDVYVASKVYPHHAAGSDLTAACDRSRSRLGLDCIDLYLLHWRGSLPLAATVEGLESLRSRGVIGRWGVSNFDVDDLTLLRSLPDAAGCATNQVWYSLGQRGVESGVLPAMRAVGMPLMAYSPIDQAALLDHAGLASLAADLGLAPAQLALAWLLRQPDVTAIPKARSRQHLEENLAATRVVLDAPVLGALDRLFPPPSGPVPLAVN